VTNSPEIAELTKSMRNQGRSAELSDMIFDRLGFNYRISDIACALLTSQLRRLEDFKKHRTEIVKRYCHNLLDTSLRLPMSWQSDGVSWFVYVVELPEKVPKGTKVRMIEDLK